MAEEVGNLKVKLSLDGADFERSMASVDRSLKALGQEMRINQNQGKDWGNSLQGLTTRKEALGRLLSTQELKVRKLNEAYQAAVKDQGENSKAAENLAIKLNKAQAEYQRTETEIGQVNAALSKLSKEMAYAENNWGKLGDAMRDAGDKLKNVGDKMKDVGKDLSMKVTAPIVAMGTLATKSAIDFESAFAGVKKTIDGSTEDFAMLEKGIRDMAKELPASTTEIAAVAEAAGQLGIQTDNVLAFTRTMIDLGEATNLSADEAATSFARFANIVGMSQEDFDKLGSSVVALGNSMATTEAEIVAMGMRLSGTGAQIGLSEAQIMALAAAMSSVGIEAEAGGTAMSTVMKKIQNAVSDGGQTLEDFATASNMSAKDFATAFQNDPISAIDAFIKGLSSSSAEGENLNHILENLGIKGIREADTLLRLAGASDLLATAVDTSTTAWKENSALSDEAAQRYATTESQLSMLKNTFNDLGITIGSIIVPALVSVMEVIKPIIEDFAEMDRKMQTVIVVIGAMAAAIGPLLVVGGILVSSIGTIVGAFGTFSAAIAVAQTGAIAATPVIGTLATVIGALTGPIGIAIAAIVAIGAALVVAYNKVDWFREGVDNAWNYLKTKTSEAFGNVRDTIQNVINSVMTFISNQLTKLKAFWNENGAQIVGIVKYQFDQISNVIKTVMGVIQGVFQMVWPLIANTVKVTWETIKLVVSTAINLVLGIIQTVLKVLQGDWKGAWNTILDTVKNIWGGVGKFLQNIDLAQMGRDIINGLIRGITSMGSALITGMTNTVKSAVDAAKNFLGINSPSRLMMGIGEDTGEGFAIGIEDTMARIRKASIDMANNAIPKHNQNPASIGRGIAETMTMQNQQPIILQVDGHTLAKITYDPIMNRYVQEMTVADNSY